METTQPIITYSYIKEGEDKGKQQIYADNLPVGVIPTSEIGISSSWQELTHANVVSFCKKMYGEGGYILPYYIDGAGYVYLEDWYKQKLTIKFSVKDQQYAVGNFFQHDAYENGDNRALMGIYSTRTEAENRIKEFELITREFDALLANEERKHP